MERSVEQADSSDNAGKSRSLDLHSIYSGKSGGSSANSRGNKLKSITVHEAKVLKRKKRSTIERRGSAPAALRRKRSRTDVLLSSFHPVFKQQLNKSNASKLKPNGLVSGVADPENKENSTCASHSSNGLNEKSHNLGNDVATDKKDQQSFTVWKSENPNGLGGAIVIPRRPRGASRRKRLEILNSVNRLTGDSASNLRSHADDQKGVSPILIVPPLQASNGKQEIVPNSEKNRDTNGLAPNIKNESISEVQALRRKVRSRKQKKFDKEKQIHAEKDEPLASDDDRVSGGFFEDDEDNLEQNAARMLSSRFDPRCTGFSGNRKMPSSKSGNECTPSQQFSGSFKSLRSDNSSVDAAGRVLRPRKRNGKGFARKRRHFYEVCFKDIDPCALIKQRIRVFWPLDQSWYFGLVKDYDPASKLHHVKYDDHDEEWIDLQNERFKLLLFPSQVSCNSNSPSLGSELKRSKQKDGDVSDGNHIGSFTESEPIISWLSRSSGSLRSSPSGILKKRKAEDLVPSTSLAQEDMVPELSTVTPYRSSAGFSVPGNAVNGNIVGGVLVNSIGDTGERKLSFVYTRKRFRKRRELFHDTPTQDFACRNSAGPISILASVADGVAALEEHNLIVSSKLKNVSLTLTLPSQCCLKLLTPVRSFWLCHAYFLLHCGKLINVWPMVHMEIVFVDNVLGLKIISFQGCLNWILGLVSLIISTFYQHTNHNKLTDQQLPSTSIGFNLLSLHGERRHLPFVLHSFLHLEKSKWEYLEAKLKYHCTKVELSITASMKSSLMNLPSRSSQMLCTTVMSTPASHEGLLENLGSNIMHQAISDRPTIMCMNPAVIPFHEKYGAIPPCAFSFAEKPFLFLGLHLKLLIERNAASLSSEKHTSLPPKESSETDEKSNADGCSLVEDSSDHTSEITLENFGSSMAASTSAWLEHGHLKVEADALSVSSDGDWMISSRKCLSSEDNAARNPADHVDVGQGKCAEKVAQSQRLSSHAESCVCGRKYCSSSPENDSSMNKCENGGDSCLNATNFQTLSCDQVNEQSSNTAAQDANHASDLAWEMLNINTPKTTAPRSVWHHNQYSSISPMFGHHSRLWPEDVTGNGFSRGVRKPRTQVSYSLPFGNCEIGSKPRSRNRRARPYKNIRIDNEKVMPSAFGMFHPYLESLICDANVLVTTGDRCWRECGAQVVLESDDQKDWRITVKFSGATKYVHKVHQSLQPGTANRYTHAMMWKGGKDWILEFTDRSQWALFKELHEECHNRNIRAASVKNIPIPGVRLIDDADESNGGVPFIRNPHKYFRQVGTEVDTALDPAHVLYDMDSDDEEWISNFRLSMDNSEGKLSEVTVDLFEMAMDMFEKFAYAHQCEEFTSDEIEEFMDDVGPLDIIKAIYNHWRQKRQKKGLPLIRQFQPPLWECYQQQLKEWELATSKMHPDGCKAKGSSNEKPPMFAFCLRPRGLEVPNKGSKQRSHKKIMYTSHHNSFGREQDGLHYFDRKLNGTYVGEDKAFVVTIPNYESFDSFHSGHASSGYSPRDSPRRGLLAINDTYERSHHPTFHRNNSKMGYVVSPRDTHMMPFSQNPKSKRNGVQQWTADSLDWPSRKQSSLDGFQRHRSDPEEFKLRDASSAAQHASNMARLKREKAQWLLHKADLALHKATVALITAEAIKASSQKDLAGDE